MKILYFKSIDSTQKYLKNLLKFKEMKSPLAIVSDIQTDGIGSRDNSWDSLSGNLFLSFTIPLENLPKDLKLESSSIYFAYLLKELLHNYGSSVWLKWPNDFYIDNLKIGGMITNIVSNNIICGVGLNLVKTPNDFAKLDIDIDREKLLNNYFLKIDKKPLWKQVFSNYKLEFNRNKNFFTHKNNLKVPLGDANLQSDGSIIIDNERMYSLR